MLGSLPNDSFDPSNPWLALSSPTTSNPRSVSHDSWKYVTPTYEYSFRGHQEGLLVAVLQPCYQCTLHVLDVQVTR